MSLTVDYVTASQAEADLSAWLAQQAEKTAPETVLTCGQCDHYCSGKDLTSGFCRIWTIPMADGGAPDYKERRSFDLACPGVAITCPF